jgi:hypothetical protein
MRATRTDNGLEALNGSTRYGYSADGGSVNGGGVPLTKFVIDQLVCANTDDVPQSFQKISTPSCTVM